MKSTNTENISFRMHPLDLISILIKETGSRSAEIVLLELWRVAAELRWKLEPGELTQEQADCLSDDIWEHWGILGINDVNGLIRAVDQNA
jgi:hypothetical protein